MPDTGPSFGGWRAEAAFLRRVLIVAAVVLLLLLAWTVRYALLLVFAAILIAILIRAVADWLHAWLRVPSNWSVAAACLLILAPIVLGTWLIGSEVRAQAAELLERLPEATATLERIFGIRLPRPGEAVAAEEGLPIGEIAMQAASYALIGLEALAALLIVLVGGVYLAASPDLYRRGVARLLPESQRGRVEEALEASGRALRLWLLAQLVAMVAVGTATGLGAWAIGLPAPLALGVFAGLVEIVPLIGPWIGAVPGVLLALNLGLETLLWTAALYLVIQQIEGNLLAPLLGQRMVHIPPALLLFSVVAAGALFGVLGVVLAAPLTVVAVVLVGKLYVQETLGKPVEVPGEKEG